MNYNDWLSPYGQLRKNLGKATLPAVPNAGKTFAELRQGRFLSSTFLNAQREFIHV
jgi:hypothetical protein